MKHILLLHLFTFNVQRRAGAKMQHYIFHYLFLPALVHNNNSRNTEMQLLEGLDYDGCVCALCFK